MEQLKVGTNDLPPLAKKNATTATASVSSTEAFPTAGLALQLEMPTAAADSIPDRKMGKECWNSGLEGWLEAMAASIQLQVVAASIQLEVVVAATSEAAWVWDTLPMASGVLNPYVNPVT
jgi:hypothetical protein